MVDYRHPRRPLPGHAASPPVPPAVDYRHPRRPPPGTGRAQGRPPRFALRRLPDGSPLRFAPDRPIEITVNTDQAGRWALDDVAEALDRVQRATGLVFRPGGLTALLPQAAETVHVDPLAPSLTIAWAKPGRVAGGSDLLPPEEPLVPGAPLALAVGVAHCRVREVPVAGGVQVVIARAVVVLDSSVRELYPPGFGTGACRGAVLLHELAHAVGLDHVDDPDQLMHPYVTDKPAAFGAGDLEGLRRVGVGAGPLPVQRPPGAPSCSASTPTRSRLVTGSPRG